jgi:hypothetical protein
VEEEWEEERELGLKEEGEDEEREEEEAEEEREEGALQRRGMQAEMKRSAVTRKMSRKQKGVAD